MDQWLKWLIAAACCVVIAGGSYFAYSEYQSAVRRAENERRAEIRGDQAMCDRMMRELDSPATRRSSTQNGSDWRIYHVSFCITNGYVSEDQFSSPRLTTVLEKARSAIDSGIGRKKD